MKILPKPVLNSSSVITIFLYCASRVYIALGAATPKPGGEEMAAGRWDQTVDFNLVVRLGAECELNKAVSEYQVQHRAQPIAGSTLGCISQKKDQALSHSAVEGKDDLLWEA